MRKTNYHTHTKRCMHACGKDEEYGRVAETIKSEASFPYCGQLSPDFSDNEHFVPAAATDILKLAHKSGAKVPPCALFV